MNVRHSLGVLHSFSIKNVFYDKLDLKGFLCSCGDVVITISFSTEKSEQYESGAVKPKEYPM